MRPPAAAGRARPDGTQRPERRAQGRRGDHHRCRAGRHGLALEAADHRARRWPALRRDPALRPRSPGPSVPMARPIPASSRRSTAGFATSRRSRAPRATRSANDGFDVEIWNELTFGSDFLDAGHLLRPAARGPGRRRRHRSAPCSTAPSRGSATPRTASPAVGISDGFASQTPFAGALDKPRRAHRALEAPVRRSPDRLRRRVGRPALPSGRRTRSCRRRPARLGAMGGRLHPVVRRRTSPSTT